MGSRSSKTTELPPETESSATEYAEQLAQAYCSRVSRAHRKGLGQFFTPAIVARFMAGLPKGRSVRMLDPAAGTGILVCALVDRLAEEDRECRLHADVYEVDSEIIPFLQQALDFATSRLPGFTYTILNKDFVAERVSAHGSLFDGWPAHYDLVVANPPYFKVRADSKIARAAQEAGIHGRTNIYAMMMTSAASSLKPRGKLVFIVPRSFCNGLYFRRFRKQLLADMSLDRVHVFESRRAAFKSDDVLQENIVVAMTRDHQASEVLISSSDGPADIDASRPRAIDVGMVFASDHLIRLPASEEDKNILRTTDSWPMTLHDLDMEISTGPIVAYRQADCLSRTEREFPLLMIHNVRRMETRWPLENGKPQYVADSPAARSWLVPNQNYVLVRRFSAKEEPHRLLAAPHLKGRRSPTMLGIENHVNFIHRPGGSLTREEAIGLAAVLNSDLLDAYFRIVNGNTQVNATDLRALPLPPAHVIQQVGCEVLPGTNWEAIVNEALSLYVGAETADV
jgi:adenine-specific DNA-methyltransferase